MSHHRMARAAAWCGALAVVIAVGPAHTNVVLAQQPAPAAGAEPKAVDQYKNIQVFKDLPASQLHDAMTYMAASIGGNCLSCHVRGEDGVFAYEKDDRDNKQTARKMIAMVRSINEQNFDGELRVTCATCHQARREPNPMPPFSQPLTPEQMAAMAARGGGPGGGRAGGPGAQAGGGRAGAPGGGRAGAPGQAGPGGGRGQRPSETVDQVIDKYVAALGGKDALAKIATRVITGTGTTRTGQSVPVTIEEKSGGRYREAVESPQAQASWTNGTSAWVGSPRGTRELDGAEARVLTRSATLDLPLRFADLYSRTAVTRYERIDDRDAISVSGQTAGVMESLSFDRETGLLVRRIARIRTPLGDLPVQIDYSDYRDVEGIKVPFKVRTTTWNAITDLAVGSVAFNTPIDDARFAPPATSGEQ